MFVNPQSQSGRWCFVGYIVVTLEAMIVLGDDADACVMLSGMFFWAFLFLLEVQT